MTWFKTPRMTSKKYRKWIASLPCVICGFHNDTVVAHHILRNSGKGMGIKACDTMTVPICFRHHQELHLNGDETDYFACHGIDDPIAVCRHLWLHCYETECTTYLSMLNIRG